jgi:hypothetical protein
MRVCVCVCVFVNVMHLFLLMEQRTSFLLQCFLTHLADSITCFRSNALQHNGRCVSTTFYNRCLGKSAKLRLYDNIKETAFCETYGCFGFGRLSITDRTLLASTSSPQCRMSSTCSCACVRPHRLHEHSSSVIHERQSRANLGKTQHAVTKSAVVCQLAFHVTIMLSSGALHLLT